MPKKEKSNVTLNPITLNIREDKLEFNYAYFSDSDYDLDDSDGVGLDALVNY